MKYIDFIEKFKNSEYFREIERLRTGSKALVQDNYSSVEIHHIYPRSFEEGKIDSKENLIKVTTAEHLFLHILLVKSFEALQYTNSGSYEKAIVAINILFHIQWKSLTKEDQDELVDKIPDIVEIRRKAVSIGRKVAGKTMLKKYGSWVGNLNTEKSIQKSLETRTEKYGSPAAQANQPEVNKRKVAHSKQTHQERYGGMTTFMNTKEAREKASSTRVKRYGYPQGVLALPEIKQRAREKILEKYGNAAGALSNPEVRKKAQETVKKRFGKLCGQMNTPEVQKKCLEIENRNRRKRMFIVRLDSFKHWYEPLKNNYKRCTQAVKAYLEHTNTNLEDYPEFIKS